MWDNMKFQTEKEWGTQKLWVERRPLGKWQMGYLVIPQETHPSSVTSFDSLSQDHFYKCKFLFTVTHITRPALNHELLMEFAKSTQGSWQSFICCRIHSQIWLKSPDLSCNSWIRSLSYMEYWSQSSSVFSGARVAMSVI